MRFSLQYCFDFQLWDDLNMDRQQNEFFQSYEKFLVAHMGMWRSIRVYQRRDFGKWESRRVYEEYCTVSNPKTIVLKLLYCKIFTVTKNVLRNVFQSWDYCRVPVCT